MYSHNLAKQMKVRIGALTSIMVLLWCGSSGSTSSAQETSDLDGRKFGDWVVRCQGDTEQGGRRCVLTQSVRLKKTEKKQPVLSTTVGYFGKSRRRGVFFTLPLGLFLPAGVMLEVDGRDDLKRLPYQVCNSQGCRASLALDDRWLAIFERGLKGTLTVRTLRGKDVAIPLSLKGFTKGIKAITAR